MSTPAHKIRLIMELRRLGIGDAAVLSAIERVPREIFVPPTFADRAYDNTALPIGLGQTLSQPYVVALMTQALMPNKRLKVLEIGTGSGYQAAVLSYLFRRVYTIERHRPLLQLAEQRFDELRLNNITAKAGDGSLGWPEQAPFERVILTACAPDIPGELVDQMAPGGIMVLPMGTRTDNQRLYRLTREEVTVREEDLGPVRFVPLVSGKAPTMPADPLIEESERAGRDS